MIEISVEYQNLNFCFLCHFHQEFYPNIPQFVKLRDESLIRIEGPFLLFHNIVNYQKNT